MTCKWRTVLTSEVEESKSSMEEAIIADKLAVTHPVLSNHPCWNIHGSTKWNGLTVMRQESMQQINSFFITAN